MELDRHNMEAERNRAQNCCTVIKTGRRRTWSFTRGLQFSQFADLILGDGRHVSPKVHVFALLQLHVHLSG